ncbi:MAG TPA: segregation/condensation protein A, partial [Fusibacter sp.]|nr:segregation/condensation protein A [Fusibacter sp.]
LLLEDSFEFTMLFGETITKEEVVVTFLALLELLKLKEITIVQDKLFGDICIQKRDYVELVDYDHTQDDH